MNILNLFKFFRIDIYVDKDDWKGNFTCLFGPAFAKISLFLSSCGGTSHRSVNHYHHGYGHSGWGNPYYDNDVIIIDNGPDIIDEIEMGMPEAVDLPMDDW